MKRIILVLTLSLFFYSKLYASKPLLGIVWLESNSARMLNVSNTIEMHLVNIVKLSGVLDNVNTTLLKKELEKFNCLEESCLLSFAKEAGLNILIRGYLEDRINSIVVNIYAYGIDEPYYGKIIYTYKVSIPFSKRGFLSLEYSNIFEEHAAYFIYQLLNRFKFKVFIKRVKERLVIDCQVSHAEFTLYRYDNIATNEDDIRTYHRIGKIEIRDNVVERVFLDGYNIKPGDFVFISFKEKARFIESFYYGRKKEIVFEEPTYRDTLFMASITVPASALMPVIAPMGYYSYNDFSGLSLWALNSFPYLYLEYQGLKNRPKLLRDEKRDIPRRSVTRYRFGIYMLLCGGMSLFVDVFSHKFIAFSSDYKGRQPYLGNNLSAAYLSIISGGGGHFYRGYRKWGYLYFHINNLLLYYTIKAFSRAENYDAYTDSYKKEEIDKKKAYTFLGVFCFVKIIEISHVLLLKDNIRNGRIIEDRFIVQPNIFFNNDGSINVYAECMFKF